MTRGTAGDTLSRRGFFGRSASALAALPMVASTHSGLSCEPAGRPLSPGSDAGTTPDITAQTDAAHHLAIDVEINGKGPFRFVVDTGADKSVIATDIAQALNLVPGDGILVEGIVRTVPAVTVGLERLSFRQFSRTELRVAVLPRAMLGADGYLGLDVIDGYLVTFDFARGVLRIEETNSNLAIFMDQPRLARVPMYGAAGHLRSINCNVDGIEATAFIDTGAEVSMGNTELLAALSRETPLSPKRAIVPLTGVTGGLITGELVPISNTKLASLRFYGGNVVIADLQIFGLWGLSKTPALLIGMNYLRTFSSVAIDYSRKEARFKLAEARDDRTAGGDNSA